MHVIWKRYDKSNVGAKYQIPKKTERLKKKDSSLLIIFIYIYIYIYFDSIFYLYSFLIFFSKKKKKLYLSLETIKPKSKNQFKREHKQKAVQHKQYGQRSVTSGESPLRFGLQVSLSLSLSVCVNVY